MTNANSKWTDYYAEEVERINRENGYIKEQPLKEVEYKFNEDQYLDELFSYITSTYGQHYSLSKIQSTEFIMDAGHGEGFCVGNIIKYAQRYGKKAGHNRADLLKVCHYAIMMLHVHDQFNTEKE